MATKCLMGGDRVLCGYTGQGDGSFPFQMKMNSLIFYHIQNGAQFETYKLFISAISPLIFLIVLDYG